MTVSYDSLAMRAVTVYKKKKKRVIICLTGVPGSGKSTLAQKLYTLITDQGFSCCVVPIDGFHYPRSYLRKMADPELAFQRRGAEFTFDASSAVNFIKQLSEPGTIIGPTFDHVNKDPVSNGMEISWSVQIVIVEGLYLLLTLSPWNQIRQYVDEMWLLEVSFATCRERVAKRHVLCGIESNMEDAYKRFDNNDLRNGEFLIENSSTPDLIIHV